MLSTQQTLATIYVYKFGDKSNLLLNMSRAREVVEVKPIRRCSDLLQCVQSQLKIDCSVMGSIWFVRVALLK